MHIAPRFSIGTSSQLVFPPHQELELLDTTNVDAAVIESLKLEHYHHICYWELAKVHSVSTSTPVTMNLATHGKVGAWFAFLLIWLD
jgi:hypothetical protein